MHNYFKLNLKPITTYHTWKERADNHQILYVFYNFPIFVEFNFLIKAFNIHKLVLRVKIYNLWEFEPSVEVLRSKKSGCTELGNSVRWIGYQGSYLPSTFLILISRKCCCCCYFCCCQMKPGGFLFPYIPLLFWLIETGRRHKAKYEKKQAFFSLAGR